MSLLSPVTAVVLGWIFLGQKIQGMALVGLIVVLALAAGALYFIPIAAQSTIMIETKQPFDPTILGGAASISSGIGQLLCVIVSFLFQGVAAASSMTVAYRVFFALCLIGLLGAILLRETGKKPEKTSV